MVFYFLYRKNLEKKIIRADPSRKTPAHRLYDGVDYVPAHPVVLYGHHFASIAGAGPIVGPAVAMAWGLASRTSMGLVRQCFHRCSSRLPSIDEFCRT